MGVPRHLSIATDTARYVAERVEATAERQPDAHPVGPIVVGVDGSEASEPALAFAFDAASRLGSVSQAVLHRVECPVAVVRAEGGMR